jgi:hypothetical protein
VARSGHLNTLNQCLLLGVERTSAGRYEMSAYDPKADVIGLSDPVDARGVAPRRGEMDVQVLCFRIRELALYRRFDVTAFDDLPACHHSRSIKAAHCECAFAKLLRHLPDGIGRFPRRGECRLQIAYGMVRKRRDVRS